MLSLASGLWPARPRAPTSSVPLPTVRRASTGLPLASATSTCHRFVSAVTQGVAAAGNLSRDQGAAEASGLGRLPKGAAEFAPNAFCGLSAAEPSNTTPPPSCRKAVMVWMSSGT